MEREYDEEILLEGASEREAGRGRRQEILARWMEKVTEMERLGAEINVTTDRRKAELDRHNLDIDRVQPKVLQQLRG
jgi:hypothetical protein